MTGTVELLLEAERRGILPDDKKALLAEARSRGLVKASEPEPTPAPVAAPEPVKEPGTFQYLFNRLKKGAAGFMGMPGDVVQSLKPSPENIRQMLSDPRITIPTDQRIAMWDKAETMDYAPKPDSVLERFVDKPIATSADYQGVAGYDSAMKTRNPGLRYTGGVAEMAGAGGPVGLAMKLKNLPALISSIVGSGIGMEGGGDVASGMGYSREAGEMMGSLAGGFTTAVTPNVLRGAGGAVVDRFSSAAQRSKAETQVAREVGSHLESYPPAKDNIARSLEISGEIPGFDPGLPARSGAPGLLAVEKRVVSASEETLNRAAMAKKESEEAIAKYVNEKFPAVHGETAPQRIEKLRTASAERLQALKTEIDTKLDDSVRVFEANPANHENGERLRTLVYKQKEVYSGIRSQKYTEVYEAANRLGVRANLDDAVKYVDDVLTSEMNAYNQAEIPSVFRQVSKEFKPQSEPYSWITGAEGGAAKPADVSFEKLHSLYKRTNSDLASLRGSTSPDKDFKIAKLEDLKTILANKIRGFEAEGFGEVAVKLKEANRFYAEEYLPRFKQGFGQDVLAKFPSGEFRTPADHVTALITKPNNATQAKYFRQLFDDVPEAFEALKNGYLDTLYRTGGVIKDGRVQQPALESFLRKHEQTLNEFPEVKKTLNQLATDNGALLERRAYVVKAEKELASHALYRLFQGRDPVQILTEATTNKNAMHALAYQARNDVNMGKGLARGIAEHVTQQADPMAFLKANEEAIRIGLKPLGDAHFKNLVTAVEAMTINARTKLPESVNAASITSGGLEGATGSSPRSIIASIMSAERGRTGYHQEVAFHVGRAVDKMRRDHKLVAMEAVFYDKDAARTIANLAKNPESKKAQMDFRAQMFSLGVRSGVAGDTDNRDPLGIR